MLLHKVLSQVVETAQPIVKKVETRVKNWTKPAADNLVGGAAADLVKNKKQLIMENALLLLKPDTLLKWHGHGFKLFWVACIMTTAGPRNGENPRGWVI